MSEFWRLLGYIFFSVVATLGVLILCWQPWLGSSASIPAERVSSLFASLGQVLLAYFSVVVAVYMSAHEASEQKLTRFRVRARDLAGPRAAVIVSDLEAKLRRLEASFGSFNAREILALVQDGQVPDALDRYSAETRYERVLMAIESLGQYEFSGTIKTLRDECMDGLLRLKATCLQECYVGDERTLLSERKKVRQIFDITIALTLVHCVLCFWPDPLLSETLDKLLPWVVRSESKIPSGVAVCGSLLILAPMFIAAYLFVRHATRIYSIGQGREET